MERGETPEQLEREALASLSPEMGARAKRIEEEMDRALAGGKDTQRLYADDCREGQYAPERAALQRQIVDDIYDKARDVPCERKAIIMGGLGGSGKTTLLNMPRYARLFGVEEMLRNFLVINRDDLKDEIIERDRQSDQELFPRVDGLTPMEHSALIHEESSQLADMLAERAMRDGKNIIHDTTLGEDDKSDKLIGDLTAHGYRNEDITGVFIDVPVKQSIKAALDRWVAGQERYERGEDPDGGRFVPPRIAAEKLYPTYAYESKNRACFEEAKERFGEWYLFTNEVDEQGNYHMKLVDSKHGRPGR